MSIKRSLAVSSMWSITASIFNTLSGTVVFIALARLLTPTQFGIVAFAAAFIEVAAIFVRAGVGDALIQRRGWDEDVASTAFWTNLAISLLISGSLSLGAFLLGGSYGGNEFPGVLAALSLLLLVEGASGVHSAKLRRDFRHKIIARRNMTANVLAGIIGVTLAYLGWGVWAMVISRLFASSMSSVLLWRSSGFRPQFSYSMDHVRELRRFSSHQLGSQLLGAGNVQISSLMIGTILGPAAIAQYRVGSRALTMLISLVITPLQSAAMSAFSRVNEQDGQIGAAYLRVTRTCALLTCPVFFGVAATAPDFVQVLFGPQWHQGGYILIALALVVGPSTLNYFQGSALAAAGKTGLNFWATLINFLTNLSAAALTVNLGPIVVAIGDTLRAHLTAPIGLSFVARAIGLRPSEAVRNIAPPYLCGAAMAAVVTALRLYVFDDLTSLPRFAASVVAGAIIYTALMMLFARRFLAQNVAEFLPLLPERWERRLTSMLVPWGLAEPY